MDIKLYTIVGFRHAIHIKEQESKESFHRYQRNDNKTKRETQPMTMPLHILFYKEGQVGVFAKICVNTEINILLDPKHNSCQGFAHTVCTNFTVVVMAHVTVIVSLF